MKKLLLILLFPFLTKAQNSNCPAYPLCNTSNFSYVPSNAGTAEINATNQGCLSTEHRSVWLQVTIATSGVLVFRVNPSVNGDDFDFAVWQTSSCPPTTAPIRCSFAAGGGNTGIGNGATDNSETAFGDKWVAPLNVTVGQVYIIMIDNFSVNSGFTLNWNYNAGGSPYNTTATFQCSTLPIELVYFGGTPKGEDNELSWITLTETNNDYYTLEQAIEALSWKPLADISGGGTVSTPSSYKFTHQKVDKTINYYRLKQVDFNGSHVYSGIISIDNTDRKNKEIVNRTNLLGQQIEESYQGVQILYYKDGTTKKILPSLTQ